VECTSGSGTSGCRSTNTIKRPRIIDNRKYRTESPQGVVRLALLFLGVTLDRQRSSIDHQRQGAEEAARWCSSGRGDRPFMQAVPGLPTGLTLTTAYAQGAGV